MGLAIDGNVVHGIARGGQAFVPYSNTLFDFSKAVFDTKIYFSDTTLIGEIDAKQGHFFVSFFNANDLAVSSGANNCRIFGATYISKDNIDTTSLNAGAGLYYLFSIYVFDSDLSKYVANGFFLIRADQVVFKPSGGSDSSMIDTNQ